MSDFANGLLAAREIVESQLLFPVGDADDETPLEYILESNAMVTDVMRQIERYAARVKKMNRPVMGRPSFASAIGAQKKREKSTEIQYNVLIPNTDHRDTARTRALDEAHRRWPVDCGWYNHQEVTLRIPSRASWWTVIKWGVRNLFTRQSEPAA